MGTSLEDKENASENAVIVIDDSPPERLDDVHSFFSPPRKKVKQDSVPLKTPNKSNRTNGVKDSSPCLTVPVEKDIDQENDSIEKSTTCDNKRKSPVNKQCVKNDNSS